MIERGNPPYAPNLIESMRSIGYSFETALADIVDNSIAANAHNVDIISICKNDKSFIAIIDDGFGMDKQDLFIAMKYGSYNPNDSRNKNDMGRFGLGLKSASLSQCRKLTVLSKKSGDVNGYTWDLDFIIERGDWILQELETEDIELVLNKTEVSLTNSGTIVLWENFDRINHTASDFDEYLKELLFSALEHFSLIYHRILNKSFSIRINGNEVVPRDPFLENHKSTQLKREQKIYVDGKEILVKPYILPHINKLTTEDIKKLGGKESLRTEQGFYIYRNKRLIIYGTWFRLGTKNELTKLARVRVDIPNDMDYLWDIDIKKSKASLPDKIKIKLYNAVLESCGISERVHEYKGKKAFNTDYVRTWNVIEKRKGEGLGLEINLDNPLIKSFIESLTRSQKNIFLSLIKDIEDTIPLDYIYSRVAKGTNTDIEYTKEEKDEILADVRKKLIDYKEIGLEINELIDILMQQEKFANDEYMIKKLLEMKG